jgi:cytidine deaminase
VTHSENEVDNENELTQELTPQAPCSTVPRPMDYTTFSALTPAQQSLVRAAAVAMETAYNPYSKFYVGCALLTRTGEIISASNVENAAYGSTICAERMALGKANSMGRRDIIALAVMGRGEGFAPNADAITGPCGSCRQMIFEASQLAGVDIECILAVPQLTKTVVTAISELLPLPFGPRELNVNVDQYRPK